MGNGPFVILRSEATKELLSLLSGDGLLSMQPAQKRWVTGMAATHRIVMRQFFVYLLASHSRRLYIGVTNDLLRRVAEHREGMCEFTSTYQITRLVYFETSESVISAIAREKQLKGWVRKKKVELVESVNPAWRDLAEGWFDEGRVDPSSLRSSG